MPRRQSGHRAGREAKKSRQANSSRKRDKPSIPAGSVPADPNKQVFGLGGPFRYYQDVERGCVQCQQVFVFAAREQKYWYETLGFIVYSTAIRCPKCRRRKRDDKTLQRQVAHARQFQREHSNDALAHLALAEALVQHDDRLQTGRLEDAIAASRKAARLDPKLHEAVYWEAASNQAMGRTQKARSLFQRFVNRAAPVHRCRVLVRRAQRQLAVESQ